MIRDPRETPDYRPRHIDPFPWHIVIAFAAFLCLLALIFNH